LSAEIHRVTECSAASRGRDLNGFFMSVECMHAPA
jgi:hypothetical protein